MGTEINNLAELIATMLNVLYPLDDCYSNRIRAAHCILHEIQKSYGEAITVWKDGTWKPWQALDAHYAENDPDFLANIFLGELPKIKHELKEREENLQNEDALADNELVHPDGQFGVGA